MKKLLTVIALLTFMACKEQPASLDKKPEVNTKAEATKDSTIGQDIWFYDGKYHLQTFVLTHPDQQHPRPNNNVSFGPYTMESPYYETISGSVEYIKSRKAIEYQKAVTFFKEKKMKEDSIHKNIEYLKKLPVTFNK